ncbi:MAG TPA: Smr/MutS family protein [Dongiaceae bacterium]|nr:Smr/MutS family protein [Dongiaceae bacterium]
MDERQLGVATGRAGCLYSCSMSKRRVSRTEAELWRAATREARPLAGRAPPPPPPAERKEPPPPSPRRAAAPPAPSPPLPELERGATVGVDRRQVERLRRGRLPIEARIDLHGMTQNAARSNLDAFIGAAAAAGKRCVLVITGKGVGRGGAGAGVLRENAPRWLNLPPNRARVLAFDHAQPRDGGDGALYVLLRRQRRP